MKRSPSGLGEASGSSVPALATSSHRPPPPAEDEKPLKGRAALDLLRDSLTDEPDYDWPAHVREAHRERRLPL